MMYDIFNVLESRLKGKTEFAGFEFFRFEGNSSNQQSNASVPFLRLFFSNEQSQRDNKRWRLLNQLFLGLEIRWKTDKSDINAIERVQERSDYAKYVKQAIFPTEDEENFLDLPYITNLTIGFKPFEFSGLEVKKHNGINLEIIIEYWESLGE
jgi:hypothetical protein